MELRHVVIEYLKESKKTLGLVELLNILLIKNIISQKERDILEIKNLREICKGLAVEGILIEKESGKFVYNNEYKGEIKKEVTESKKELKDIVIEYLKESNKTLSLVELFNILLIKDLISDKDRANLKIADIKGICESSANEGVLIEKTPGKFAYNHDHKEQAVKPAIMPEQSPPQITPRPRESNSLDMMWQYAEHKTNKKLTADEVFNFYAEEKKRGELVKVIDDFIDYFKIEKNKENLATWEQNFSNALLIQGIISKWD